MRHHRFQSTVHEHEVPEISATGFWDIRFCGKMVNHLKDIAGLVRLFWWFGRFRRKISFLSLWMCWGVLSQNFENMIVCLCKLPTVCAAVYKQRYKIPVRWLKSCSSFQNISKTMISFSSPEPEKWVERYRKPPMVTDCGPLFLRFWHVLRTQKEARPVVKPLEPCISVKRRYCSLILILRNP